MMRKIIILLFGLFVIVAATSVFAQNADLQAFNEGNITKFSTKGHPKAKGINISVEYPSQWKASEGNGPNVVQKFSADASDGITRLVMILIQNTPEVSSLSEDDINEAFSEDSLKEDMVPPGGSYISGERTEYDGQPGAWVAASTDSERAGMKFKSYVLLHIFFYRGKSISIQCMVGGLEQMNEALSDEFSKYITLFQQIGDSVIIQDKGEKNDNVGGGNELLSALESLYGSPLWLAIIVLFLITWAIGLIPPLIIRYLIVRRPLSKSWAIGLVVSFLIINISIFTALGSRNKTHAVLFLVAYFSYIILNKGYNGIKKGGKR